MGAPCDGEDSDLCAEGVGACVEGAFICSDTTGDDVEVCNGLDDDCNGFLDDDAIDAGFFYQDDDGDGFGDIESELVLCEAPGEGWIGVGGDCNDTPGVGADFNPLADEICDGLDNDCDTLVDGEDPDALDVTEAWPDNDGDGFGDEDGSAFYCEVPDDLVLNGSDCDDSDAGGDVNPDAAEVCDDGIDNDCDGGADCADFDCAADCGGFDCVDGEIEGFGTAIFVGNTDDSDDSVGASCAGGGGSDLGLLWTAPETGQYRFNTLGSDYDTAIFLLDTTCDGEELICNDDAFGGSSAGPGGLLSQIEPPLEEGQRVVIMLAGYQGDSGNVQLNIELAVDEICDDGIDNNRDGALDCLDDACVGTEICTEDCSDGIDNDVDGLTDCLDLECRGTDACIEICDNGTDDTGEGLVDCEDPSCALEVVCRPDSCGDETAEGAFGEGAIEGTRSADEWTLACGPIGGADAAVVWNSGDYAGPVRFSVRGDAASLSVFAGCEGTELYCAAEGGEYELDVDEGESLALVVDSTESVDDLSYAIDIAIPEDGLCGDGLDNDLNGLTDCEDPACSSEERCLDELCPLDDLGSAIGEAVVSGSTTELFDITEGECADNSSPDATYTWTAPAAGETSSTRSAPITTRSSTSRTGAAVTRWRATTTARTSSADRVRSQIVRAFAEGETVTINIAGWETSAGNYELNILRIEVCDDGEDNDGDELVDCLDPDCAGTDACVEICDDGDDNNGDALTDCEDPSCVLDEACCAEDVFEPNTGVAGSVSTLYDAYLENADATLTLPTGDVDSFRIPVCDGAILTVNATFSHDEGNIDLRLLANPIGEFARADSEDDNEELVQEFTSDGDIFLFRDGDALLCDPTRSRLRSTTRRATERAPRPPGEHGP